MSLSDKKNKEEHLKIDGIVPHGSFDNFISEILDIAPLTVHFFDQNANLFDCNQAAMRAHGIDNRQEYIDNFFMFMPFNQSDGRRSRDVLQQLVSEAFEVGHAHATMMFRKSDGTPSDAELTFVKLSQAESPIVVSFSTEPESYTPTISSDNKDVDSDLRASLMLDATPMACFLADNKYKAIDCNAEVLQLFGYSSKGEAISRFYEICPQTQTLSGQDVESINSAIHKALVAGRYVFEFTCFDISGKPIPCNITLVRIHYRKEHVVAIYMQDLREMNAIVEQMKRIEIAEEESRAKSRFLAKMSHEIRTPLTAILGLTEMQLLGGNNTEEVEDVFSQIYSSSSMLLRIINDLLDLSKVEAEKMVLITNKYDVPSLIADTVQLNLTYLSDKDVVFEVDADPSVPKLLIGDELRIKQVLNNILSNAFKYTKTGIIKLIVGMEKTSSLDTVMLVLRVRDTGPGMSKKQMDSLFVNEYVRYDEEDNRDVQGTGLGLSITYELVSMMNGNIFVNSKLGEGTEFTIKLPQTKYNDEILGEEHSQNLGGINIIQQPNNKPRSVVYTKMPYGRILVVDDIELNLLVVTGMLSPYGLQIDTAISGQEAIDKVSRGEVYDIIFMDHMMPGLDGIETAKIIMGMGYEHPIIALTANAIAGHEEMFIKNGFADFLSKPVDVQKLNSCLMTFIHNKHQKQAKDAVEVVEISVSK